jgi:hypothetical protein
MLNKFFPNTDQESNVREVDTSELNTIYVKACETKLFRQIETASVPEQNVLRRQNSASLYRKDELHKHVSTVLPYALYFSNFSRGRRVPSLFHSRQ